MFYDDDDDDYDTTTTAIRYFRKGSLGHDTGALLSVNLIWVAAIVDALDLCCYNIAILYHLTTIFSWALFSLAVVSSRFQ